MAAFGIIGTSIERPQMGRILLKNAGSEFGEQLSNHHAFLDVIMIHNRGIRRIIVAENCGASNRPGLFQQNRAHCRQSILDPQQETFLLTPIDRKRPAHHHLARTASAFGRARQNSLGYLRA